MPTFFASEFGCVVMSSFESMSPTLDPAHWGLHGGSPPDTCTGGFNSDCKGNNVMAQRNYPCDSVVDAYFNVDAHYYADVGEEAFKRQLFHCMLGQALEMKSNIETRKAQNEIGHIIWQLNEIWPTGAGAALSTAPRRIQVRCSAVVGNHFTISTSQPFSQMSLVPAERAAYAMCEMMELALDLREL